MKRERLTLLLIVVLGLALRLPLLDYSFYGDEQFSLLRDSKELVTSTEDRFRPVFFSLLYLWRQAGFSGEVGLRLLPLIFGLLQIPLAYFVGRRLGGRTLAAGLAVLVAASPMLVEFSQELRMYSMVGCLGLAQILLALRLVERPRWKDWALFVFVGLVGVYTHLHYWLFLAGFGVTFLRERRTLPLWQGWGALALIVLLYLPNIPHIQAFQERRGGDYVVHLPSVLPKLATAVTVGFNYFALSDQPRNRPVVADDLVRNAALFALAAIPALILLAALVRLHIRGPRGRPLWLAHETFTIPVLLGLVACMVTRQYWLQPKYIIFVVPSALLFLALAWQQLPWRALRASVAGAGALVAALALLHFWQPQQFGRREDWRGAANLLRTSMGPNSALVVVPGTYNLLSYYWPAVASRWTTIYVPNIYSPSAEYVWGLKQRLSGRSDVFYLWYDIRQNVVDPRNVLLHSLDYLGTRTGVTTLNPRFKLYHWQLTQTPEGAVAVQTP